MTVFGGLIFFDNFAGVVVPVYRFQQSGIVVHGFALNPDGGLENGFSAIIVPGPPPTGS